MTWRTIELCLCSILRQTQHRQCWHDKHLCYALGVVLTMSLWVVVAILMIIGFIATTLPTCAPIKTVLVDPPSQSLTIIGIYFVEKILSCWLFATKEHCNFSGFNWILQGLSFDIFEGKVPYYSWSVTLIMASFKDFMQPGFIPFPCRKCCIVHILVLSGGMPD